jgi:hypothetical protein
LPNKANPWRRIEVKGAYWSEGAEWSDPLAMYHRHHFIAYSNSTEHKYLNRLFEVNMQKMV